MNKKTYYIYTILFCLIVLASIISFVGSLTEEERIVSNELIEQLEADKTNLTSTDNSTTNEEIKFYEVRKGRMYLIGIEVNPFVLALPIVIVIFIVYAMLKITGGGSGNRM